ncbi:MAG: type 1 glutamine amidotransferase [Actinomycetota bacterium]
MRVVIIRHHLEDSGGLVADAFQARGAQLSTHLIPGDDPPPALDRIDHIVMLGATCAVYDASVPWIGGELDWLRAAGAAGVPVLGICFGAQELAVVSGGQVAQSPRAEVGWITVDSLDPGLIPGGPWLEFHNDRCTLPASATLLARTELAVQAFSVGRNLAVQFHPEVAGAQLELWLNAGGRQEALKAGVDPDRLLAQTFAQEPAARRRADQLVETALSLANAGVGG